jgi:hypothetical protein
MIPRVCTVCQAEHELSVSAMRYLNHEPYVCSAECLLDQIKMCGQHNGKRKLRYVPYKEENHSKTGEFWSDHFQQFFASGYEEDVARVLECNRIIWKYEKFMFFIGTTIIVPDFYLPEYDLFVEVKGLWRGNAKGKFSTFKYCYPKVKMILVPYTLRVSVQRYLRGINA